MISPFYAALIGFCSAIVGGLIQAWFTRKFEVSRFKRQNKYEAYLAYLKGISRLSFAVDSNEAHLEALTEIAEARGRIALCGSDHVIKQMLKVFAHGSDIYSPEARADLGAMIGLMRADSQISKNLKWPSEMFEMVFGNSKSSELK
jgi:hypothetical protein